MKKTMAVGLAILVFVTGVLAVGLLTREQKSASAVTSVRLSEVMANNKGACMVGGGVFDFVEIYNAGDTITEISGLGLSDTKDDIKWVFPEGTRLGPHEYALAYLSGDITLGPLHAPFSLNTRESVYLFDAAGELVEEVELFEVQSGYSIGINEQGTVEAGLPTPGFDNSDRQGYLSALSADADDKGVRINEFMVKNASIFSAHAYPDWIELYNTSPDTVELEGFGLSDDINRPLKWQFPKGAQIAPGETLLIFCTGRNVDDLTALECSFRLNSYSGEVILSYSNGAVIDSVSYTDIKADSTMKRTPDGTGAFSPGSQPTPGFKNTNEGYISYLATVEQEPGRVFFSEALAGNESSFTYNGETPDFIELGANETTSLNGYSITDNPQNKSKWTFPDITLNAGEVLVVLATGNDKKEGDYLEAGFSLAQSGETLYLYDDKGELADILRIDDIPIDVSIGRTDGQLRYYDTPSPGQPNDTGFKGVLNAPRFSVSPGIYDNTVELELLSEEGALIYYTTDASYPGENATLYSAPISINANTVIRAVAKMDDYISFGSVSGTYLFTSDGVNHNIPVATLTMDPDDLWNETTGIYANGPDFDPDDAEPFSTANYYKKGDEWERPANFAIFGEDGMEQFNQNIYARIAGSYGRRHPQKGFNLIARDSAGNDRMEYAFFDNRPFNSYKALVLRAGAQDQPLSKIRDELASGLLEGTDVNILFQAYKPYVLYLNGEYWGLYFLKEKRNRFFVAQHENLTNNTDLDLIKAIGRVNYGTDSEWAELMSYVKSHDLSSKEAYDYVASKVDLTSFRDYMAAEIYVANSDYGNIQYYKTANGKWKWIYYDFCWGFHQSDHKTITLRRQNNKPCSDLFNALLKNPEWKDDFVKRLAELSNSVYSVERVNAYVDELYAIVEPEIERERSIFNQATFRGVQTEAQTRSSYKTFETHIQRIRDFAATRQRFIKDNIVSELGLSREYVDEVFK